MRKDLLKNTQKQFKKKAEGGGKSARQQRKEVIAMTTLERMTDLENEMADELKDGIISYYEGEKGETISYSFTYTEIKTGSKEQAELKANIIDFVHRHGGKIISPLKYNRIIAVF